MNENRQQNQLRANY